MSWSKAVVALSTEVLITKTTGRSEENGGEKRLHLGLHGLLAGCLASGKGYPPTMQCQATAVAFQALYRPLTRRTGSPFQYGKGGGPGNNRLFSFHLF